MLLLQRGPISPYVVQMFEWFEDPSDVTIIMEYPHPCQTLFEFITFYEKLDEETARVLMRQAVQAVQHCLDQKVFHTDIHSSNILINTLTLELKLIDFGCALLLTKSAYSSSEYNGELAFCFPLAHVVWKHMCSLSILWTMCPFFLTGAPEIRSPEVITKKTFRAVPLSVWQLGVILYEMVNGCSIDYTSKVVEFENPNLSAGK